MAACGTTIQPTATPTVQQPGSNGIEAAQRAAEALAAQLNLDVLDVSILSVESVQWPDTCLGVNAEGTMCAMHVVPGYRIVLETGARTYTFHTNEDGSNLVAVPDLTLTWQMGDQCQISDLNYEKGITYGPCNGDTQTIPFSDSVRQAELAGFAATLASFSAETPVGNVEFFGMGQKGVTPTRERMLAEWARVVADEASETGAGAARNLAIAWHRDGGIAGFCDDLTVYMTGDVKATSCAGTQPQEVGQYRLNPEQIQQVYTWVDTLMPFEVEQKDDAAADAMTIQLSLNGLGSTEATAVDRQEIKAFAADLYLQISQGEGIEPPAETPNAGGDPAQLVGDLLKSVQDNPSDDNSLAYLSPVLQTLVQGGQGLDKLLGLEGTFRSFGISGIQMEDGGKYALVGVGLNFVSPVKRAFELVQENGRWVIDAFVIYGVPAMNVPADVTGADQAILGYVHALQDKNAAAAWVLLNQGAQARVSEADLATMARAAEKIVPVSLDLAQVSSDQLVYTVDLWVVPSPNQPGDWLMGANTRTFYLTQTPTGWRIDRVAKPASGSEPTKGF